jgi:hypothetical protein
VADEFRVKPGTPVKQSGYGSLAGSAAVEAFQNTKRYGTTMPRA